MTLLLRGVVGSTAYGLAREGSDVDRIGVFVAPTVEVAGLNWHPSRESQVTNHPDQTLHEIGKYLRLALNGNPTITELLWLDYPQGYDVLTAWGERLVGMRDAFLWTGGVQSAYGGYARQQAHRLRNRGDGSFSADTRKRTAKHARHLLRLLRQGREMLATGQLTVRLPDPADYFAFDTMTPEEMLTVYEREDALFTATTSVLPAEPARARVARFLTDVRTEFLTAAAV